MKTYPVVEITFSPTGGTKKVADQISCYLGNITNTVNLIRHDVSFSDVTVPSDSLAVIAAPVFEGVIPDIAIERMKEIQGNHANCVVIAVYGNRAYYDGLIQLKDTAEFAVSMLSPPLQLLQNILSCANSAVDDQTKKIAKS